MAEAKTTMRGELTISPYAFYTLVKLKEELEDVIETIEIMNDKELMGGCKGLKRTLKRAESTKFEHRKEVYK